MLIPRGTTAGLNKDSIKHISGNARFYIGIPKNLPRIYSKEKYSKAILSSPTQMGC